MMDWEFDILYALQSIRNPILDSVMITFTKLGDAGILWIAIAAGLMFTKKYRKCGVAMILSLLVSLITCNFVLKNLVMRDRPCWIDNAILLLIDNPNDYSFPSGHTYASVVSAYTIYLYHKNAGRLALGVASIIALSRLYLFVHFPTDVAVSVILAVITAIVVVATVNKYYDFIIESIKELHTSTCKRTK